MTKITVHAGALVQRWIGNDSDNRQWTKTTAAITVTASRRGSETSWVYVVRDQIYSVPGMYVTTTN